MKTVITNFLAVATVLTGLLVTSPSQGQERMTDDQVREIMRLLGPGETLKSVNNVPIQQMQLQRVVPLSVPYTTPQVPGGRICPNCGKIHAPGISQGTVGVSTGGVQWPEVNRDPRAYAWAKEEATINARRGRSGHSKGCAPGTYYSGTGQNHDPNTPWHCYGPGQRRTRMLPNSRLVARARVIDNRGRVYWSAHYR